METQKRGAILEKAENDEKALRSNVVIYPGKKGRKPGRMEPDPAEIAGGDAPPCAEPPAAPTLYQSTAEPDSI